MLDLLTQEWAVLAAICLVTAAMSVLWLAPRRAAPLSASGRPGHDLDVSPVFLFDGPELIDASDAARVISGNPEDGVTWQNLRDRLLPNFPGFPVSPELVRDAGQICIPAQDCDPPQEALCEWIDGIIRVQLRPNEATPAVELPSLAQELDILRTATDAAPYPVWRVDGKGRVTWCNAAYSALVRKVRGRDADAAAPLFPDILDDVQPSRKLRLPITLDCSNHKLWYDVWPVPQKTGFLCYAMDVNAVVDAEVAQRNFVQTLTKTFAQLSIGLAIFDRNRQLALFNPALIDLTALPASFLSGRPSLLGFFDRLRDRSMMPEPKNYSSWRQQMADLVEAAASGQYQETWTLPSGSVYSISGRPHPDGAVAFLFEDITAEITLTRRFRAELELGQAILDRLEDAIAVFTPDGTLTFCNAAYRQLWGVDPDRSFAQETVLDAMRNWQSRSCATPIWGELRDFVATRENRAEWSAEVQLRAGELLDCRVCPIANGATMVRFAYRVEDGVENGPEDAAEGEAGPRRAAAALLPGNAPAPN